MGYHIKTTPEQDQRLRVAFGKPGKLATDAEIVDAIVELTYQYLVGKEAESALVAASISQAQVAHKVNLLRQQEKDIADAAELVLREAELAVVDAKKSKPGNDWKQK